MSSSRRPEAKIVTAFAPVQDVRRTLTPQLQLIDGVETERARRISDALIRSGYKSPILPNIRSTVVADGWPRLTFAILLVAAVNFLGVGLRPPAADWALMISENRAGLSLQPWALGVPAVLIAVLTVAINVVADQLSSRAAAESDVSEPA